MKKDMGFLFIVFVLYVGIRLVPFFSTFDNTSRFFLADSYSYNLLGVNLAQHDYYTPNGGEPGLSRAPGYPVYLAAVYKIFGAKPAIALFLQIVLSGLIPISSESMISEAWVLPVVLQEHPPDDPGLLPGAFHKYRYPSRVAAAMASLPFLTGSTV